jgi:hypothetical protein
MIRNTGGWAMKKIIALLTAAGMLTAQVIGTCAVHAEGTQDILSDKGSRPYTEYYNDADYAQQKQTVLHVYMNAGETAYFGTSVSNAISYELVDGEVKYPLFSNSAMGTSYTDAQLKYVNTGDIYVTSGNYSNIAEAIGAGKTPKKETVALIDLPSDANKTTPGYIYDRTQEKGGADLSGSGTGYKVSDANTIRSDTEGYVAGAKTNANAYTASVDGIYTVVFFSSRNAYEDSLKKDTEDTDPFAITQGGGTIASWDISVYKQGVKQSGRVFTSALNLNAGENALDANGVSTGSLYTKFYAVTNDGYQYQIDLNGLDASELTLYANKRGIVSLAGDGSTSSLLHSVRSDRNDFSDLGSHKIDLNQYPYDDSLDAAYNLFFEAPSADALKALSIQDPQNLTADGISGFSFTGEDSSSGVNYAGKGGTFRFTSTNTKAGSYQIELNFGTGNVVTLSNTLMDGMNSIYWDGKDAKGSYVPANTYTNVTLKLKSGEIHLPLLDAEQDPEGIQITRTNGSSTDTAKVYYNNSAVNAGDTSLTWSKDSWIVGDEKDASNGEDSSSGAMVYTNTNTAGTSLSGDGDRTAIDLWTYGSSVIVPLSFSYTLTAASFTATSAWANVPSSVTHPSTVTMTLAYSDGTPLTSDIYGNAIDPVAVTDSYTWKNLDAAKTYTVIETPVAGYTSSTPVISGDAANGYTTTITNTFAPASLTLSCIWNNTGNTGTLPSSAVIHVYTSAAKTQEIAGSPFTLSGPAWSTTVTNLDPNATYYAFQDTVTDYVSSTGGMVNGNARTGFTEVFTNTYEAADKYIARVLFQWPKEDDANNYRPDTVSIKLYADGVETNQTAVLSEANSWYYAWSNLPKQNASGTDIEYTFTDQTDLMDDLPRYTIATDPEQHPLKTADQISIVYNGSYRTTSFTVNKTWVHGTDQASNNNTVAVQLQQSVDARTYTNVGDPVTVADTKTWTGLLSYTAKNEPIHYRAVETVPSGYTASYGTVNGNAKDGYTETITNTYNYTKFTVKDNSTGTQRPASLRVVLYDAPGFVYDTCVLNAVNHWTYTFDGLPVKDSEGNAIAYTVQQAPVTTYVSSATAVSGDAVNGYSVIFTNTYETTSFSGSATLINGTNTSAPSSLQLQLEQSSDNGKTYTAYGSPVTVDKASSWAHLWQNLPAVSFSSTPYLYRINETVPAGYHEQGSAVSGSITTGYTQKIQNFYAYTELTVSDASTGTRPAATTVTVYQNGTAYKTCTLNAQDHWTYTFTDLPLYDKNGSALRYSATQNAIVNYQTSNGELKGNPLDGYTVTFTNTYVEPASPSPLPTEDTAEYTAPDTRDGTDIAFWMIVLLFASGIAMTCSIRRMHSQQ